VFSLSFTYSEFSDERRMYREFYKYFSIKLKQLIKDLPLPSSPPGQGDWVECLAWALRHPRARKGEPAEPRDEVKLIRCVCALHYDEDIFSTNGF